MGQALFSGGCGVRLSNDFALTLFDIAVNGDETYSDRKQISIHHNLYILRFCKRHIYMLDQASIVAGGGRGQQHGTTGRSL